VHVDPNAILQAKYREGCALLGDLKMQAKELAERIAVVEVDLASLRKLAALFPPEPAEVRAPAGG
jgi:hypothetical protein